MDLSVGGDLAVLGAGFAAGAINAIVGSGSLVTFPTLLALGMSPLAANVTNSVGLVPGSIAGAVGYRREIASVRGHVVGLVAFTVAGGAVGSTLLLTLPSTVFSKLVPVLVLLAVALMALQPRLSAALARRGRTPAEAGTGLRAGIFLTGIYGGYFGAAQGVILLGLLGLLLPISLQQANGIKNVLAAVVNAVAGIVFAVFAHVAWVVALVLAVGSTFGGVVGARYGRRLPPAVLRRVVVVGGTIVGVVLLIQDHG